MSENTLLNDSKFVELMEKLNSEQSKFHADKKSVEDKVKSTVDAAKRKVIIYIYSL